MRQPHDQECARPTHTSQNFQRSELILYIVGATNANDAIHISLVNSEKTISTFHPKFTYPIFGDEESIFGYQGLKINLKYHASDMRPVLQVTYNKKFKPVDGIEPEDLKEKLAEFLPKSTLQYSRERERS